MANSVCPIAISAGNCGNCFKCGSECNVKAIKFNTTHPQVNPERCIACGHCIDICPINIISAESHIERVKRAFKNNSIIIASIAPNWITEFNGVETTRMIEALRLTGFTHVSETAIGATLTKIESAKKMGVTDDLIISNKCPAVTKLIKTTYPNLTQYIEEIVHPTIAHARYLKHIYGKEAVVVAIDSCTATKTFVDEQKGVDSDIYAALTFEELRDLMMGSAIEFDMITGNSRYQFVPFEATDDNLYVIPRGVYNHNFLSEFNLPKSTIYNYTGIERIQNILESLDKEDRPKNTYLEFFACKDGCLHGAGAIDSLSIITKRAKMNRYEQREMPYDKGIFPILDLSNRDIASPVNNFVSEEQIRKNLEYLYMDSSEDPSNCGGCGYSTCRSFAKALALELVRADMCIHYKQQLAQNKFTLLLSQMQSGVAVVGSDLKIIEANRSFAVMLGANEKLGFDTNPGMEGVDIAHFFSFHKYVSQVVNDPDTVLNKDVQVKDKILNLTIFTLQREKMVCIFARNLFVNNIRNDEIISRTRNVINDNLETVQKIAYLLGENASKTEAVLNSIIESQTVLNER